MSKKFRHLCVPEQWRPYWSRYPEGYTILEALINWVSQVNDMTDNLNEINETMDNFIATFDTNLQDKVIQTLSEWQESGFLDIVIDQALQTQLDTISDEVNTISEEISIINEEITKIPELQTQIDSISEEVANIPEQPYIQDKVKKGDLFINVKDYGAVGDGETDDTESIQNAIDYAATFSGGTDGALVFFPAGTYLISQSIKTYGNITLEGVGRRGSTLKLKAGSNADALLVREDNGATTYWVQIKNMCLDGQAHLQTTRADGIRLENVTECLIENVGIRFVRGHAIRICGINGNTSIQPTIKDCIIRADKEHHPDGACGILLDAGSYDGIVIGNDIGFYKNGYGIMLNAHYGANLSNNNVWQCKNGYYFHSAKRFRMTDCLSDYAQEQGYNLMNCEEFQLSNCQSRWSGNKAGTYQIYDGFHLWNCRFFTISNPLILAGDGSTSIDGGFGYTAFGISFTGNTSDGKVSGWLARNTKGNFYKDPDVQRVNLVQEITLDEALGLTQ